MDMTWQGSVDIAAPVEKVYAYLADFPKHCEWAQTLEQMEQKKPGDASGVGSVYKTTERQKLQSDRPPRGPMPAGAFKGTTECEITELVPNRRVAWRSHPAPVGMGVNAAMSFDLTPLDGNQTRLAQNIKFHQAWLTNQIFTRLVFRKQMENLETKQEAQWQASLNNIKAIMEEPA
ncbi:MAG: SRPBCC family protein [Thermomicrobiales bacterium]